MSPPVLFQVEDSWALGSLQHIVIPSRLAFHLCPREPDHCSLLVLMPLQVCHKGVLRFGGAEFLLTEASTSQHAFLSGSCVSAACSIPGNPKPLNSSRE